MAVLEDWGVTPQAVVGHSSGELTAACAAGYLSKEDALKAAFYRGQATKNSKADSVSVGMLAVGLGPEAVAEFIQDSANTVQIACFNSPNSVTPSGALSSLEEVKAHLVDDGHFARMLQVNPAYHSRYMTEIGQDYEALLDTDFEHLTSKRANATMFSSVFGRKMKGLTDAHYWKTNMVSPVMFDQAAQAMVSGKEGATFLIEICPSNALSGPIKQILAVLGSQGNSVQNCTALSRVQDSNKSTYVIAGRLFASGGTIDLAKVNTDKHGAQGVAPTVIVDLPKYIWNTSSFRCFDMSHKHVSDALIARYVELADKLSNDTLADMTRRLLDQLMGLVKKGQVKPIDPIKTFSFEDIPSAVRFMRGVNPMAKL